MVQISACKKDLEISNLADQQRERHESAAVLRSTTTNPFLDDPHFRNLVRLATRDNQLVNLFYGGQLDTVQIWEIMGAVGIDPYTLLPVGPFNSDSTSLYLDVHFPVHPINGYFDELLPVIDSFYNSFAAVCSESDSIEVSEYFNEAFELVVADLYIWNEAGVRNDPDPCMNCYSLFEICKKKASSSATATFVAALYVGLGATVYSANWIPALGGFLAGGVYAGIGYLSDVHNCRIDIDYCLSYNGCPPCTSCGSGGGGVPKNPRVDMQKM